MYLGTREHFQCDGCSKTEYVLGFPLGWCWYYSGEYGKGGRVAHACKDCRKNVPTHVQREPGQKK
jgi:hypothetical protein